MFSDCLSVSHDYDLGYCAPHLSLLFKLNSFFSLVLFSPGIHNGREKKLANNYMLLKPFLQDVMYLFCCQWHLKYVLENYRFCRRSDNGAYSRGWGSCYMRHYDVLRTRIDDLPLNHVNYSHDKLSTV